MVEFAERPPPPSTFMTHISFKLELFYVPEKLKRLTKSQIKEDHKPPNQLEPKTLNRQIS